MDRFRLALRRRDGSALESLATSGGAQEVCGAGEAGGEAALAHGAGAAGGDRERCPLDWDLFEFSI